MPESIALAEDATLRQGGPEAMEAPTEAMEFPTEAVEAPPSRGYGGRTRGRAYKHDGGGGGREHGQ